MGISSNPSENRPATTRVNPQEILYSLPTLNDELPAFLLEKELPPETLIIHEDDWRQFELVSASLSNVVNEELADIANIYESHSVRSGEYWAFRQLHIRKRITQPISPLILNSLIKPLFRTKLVSLSFAGSKHPLRNVIATKAEGFIFYLAHGSGSTHCLGLHRAEPSALDHDFCQGFARFMEENHLMLVHWPSRTVFPSPDSVANYLEGKNQKG